MEKGSPTPFAPSRRRMSRIEGSSAVSNVPRYAPALHHTVPRILNRAPALFGTSVCFSDIRWRFPAVWNDSHKKKFVVGPETLYLPSENRPRTAPRPRRDPAVIDFFRRRLVSDFTFIPVAGGFLHGPGRGGIVCLSSPGLFFGSLITNSNSLEPDNLYV